LNLIIDKGSWMTNDIHFVINQDEKYLQNTSERMDINLIRIFKLGPDVSFRGSPTISPITAAL